MTGQQTGNGPGFGGRTYSAKGRTLHINPLVSDTGVSLGFPFAKLTDAVDDDVPGVLAEYLSSPVRAAAPDLYAALRNMVSLAKPHFSDASQMLALKESEAALAKARGEQ